METATSPPERREQEQQNVVIRVANLPLVRSTCDMVYMAYSSSKDRHPCITSACGVAERRVKTLAEVAASCAQPVLISFELQLAAANVYACKGLDKLEEKLPILQQPADQVFSGTKELVSSKVTDAMVTRMTEVVDVTKEAFQGGVKAARSIVTSGMSRVMDSRMGQMAVVGAEAVLGKSEELVDHYLPITDEELAKLAASAGGIALASVQQQKYFVRLGSLSTKLHQRAYLHVLGKVRPAWQGIQESLFQLQYIIDLIESVKQGVDQKLQDSQEKLHQMWLHWSGNLPEKNGDISAEELEKMESLALVMSHKITRQLQDTCLSLESMIQGLPFSIQDQMKQAYCNVAEIHASFSATRSFQDLSGNILIQSQGKVAMAQKYMEELLEYLKHNIPLSWLVGPFSLMAKASTTYQEAKEEEEEKE